MNIFRGIQNLINLKSEDSEKLKSTSGNFKGKSVETGKTEGKSRFSAFLNKVENKENSIFDHEIEGGEKLKKRDFRLPNEKKEDVKKEAVKVFEEDIDLDEVEYDIIEEKEMNEITSLSSISENQLRTALSKLHGIVEKNYKQESVEHQAVLNIINKNIGKNLTFDSLNKQLGDELNKLKSTNTKEILKSFEEIAISESIKKTE